MLATESQHQSLKLHDVAINLLAGLARLRR
jgi:hypothetical protein